MTTMTPSPRPTSEPTLDLDGLDLAAIRAGALAGRPVAVLGFARSGIALARFFVDAGAVVTIYDGRPASELDDAVRQPRGSARPIAGRTRGRPGRRVARRRARRRPRRRSRPTIRRPSRASGPRSTALRTARQAGDRTAPAIVSEPDLVLRLCPAPTIGVTGTKGKTTTSALSHALLAADPTHRAILGGNIGRPLVERLPELRPDDRVVIELSELQLPTLSRGTSVAVFTNVTSDHLDRHGTLEAYRAVKRRFAEMADPAGALVVNLDDPVTAGYAGLGGRRTVAYRLDRPTPGGLGTVDGWIVADGVERLALAGPSTEPVVPVADGRILPVDELRIPGRHNVSNALAAVAVALLFGIPPEAIRAAAGAFGGVEHRLETVGIVDGVRLRQRLAGHPAGCRHRRAAGLRPADRAHRRRTGQGRST